MAAGRTDTFLGERYRRIARRRGANKAIVAVGRSILIIVWHLLADPTARFQDLGAGFYDTRINAERTKRNHLRQLEALGYKVTWNPPPESARIDLLGPGSAALRRVLPPTQEPGIFGSAWECLSRAWSRSGWPPRQLWWASSVTSCGPGGPGG